MQAGCSGTDFSAPGPLFLIVFSLCMHCASGNRDSIPERARSAPVGMARARRNPHCRHTAQKQLIQRLIARKSVIIAPFFIHFYDYHNTSILTPTPARKEGGAPISPLNASVFDVCFSAPSETAPHACRATHRVYT